MRTILARLLLCSAAFATSGWGAEVTFESLLGEMLDNSAVARWPEPEFTCRQASSYDRGTVAPGEPGWFANSDQNQFIRVETNQARTEKVMMDAVEIEWPASDNTPRSLVLYATQASDYGTLAFLVNGQRVNERFDGYAKSVQPAATFQLGVFAPQNGRFTLRIEVAGANPAATGAKYFVGLDCVVAGTP